MNRLQPHARHAVLLAAASLLTLSGCAAPVSPEPPGEPTPEGLVINPLIPFGIVTHTVTGNVAPNLVDTFDSSPPLFGAQIYEYDFKLDPFDISTHWATISASSDIVEHYVDIAPSSDETLCQTRKLSMTIARYVPGSVIRTPWGGTIIVDPSWVDIATIDSGPPHWERLLDSHGYPSRGVCKIPSVQWSGVIQHLHAIRATVSSTMGDAFHPGFVGGDVSYSGTSQ